MKNALAVLVLMFVTGLTPLSVSAASSALTDRLRGYILLQVEAHGEAWYVNPDDGLRYYMRDGEVAYALMRLHSIGITNRDLTYIPSVSTVSSLTGRSSVCSSYPVAGRMKGRILLQVEAHGEAWYVDPQTCYRVYMKDGAEAYSIMRLRSLGITNDDLNGIPAYAGELVTATITSAASPALVPSGQSNPLFGLQLYLSPNTHVAKQMAEWGTSRADDSRLMSRIAEEPTGIWFGDWNDDVKADVNKVVTAATASGTVPVLVVYSIPDRDCGGSYSAGGVSDAADYHDWVTDFAAGIGSRKAIVVIEPDGIALDCFTDARGAMIADAVRVLKKNSGTTVYLDAGHPNWTPATVMASRLKTSGVAVADGFALNVSNFYSTESNIVFGQTLSAMLNGKHFVIDTGRNANGWPGEWCNPQGAGIGVSPTTQTTEPLLDALLWIKPPGDSDGYCNGGPAAGAWWPDYALKLVRQAD